MGADKQTDEAKHDSNGATDNAGGGLKLHHYILIAMLLGAAVGLPLNILGADGTVAPEIVSTIAGFGKGLGDLFLRLLKMIVVPLIISSLIVGVTSMGNLKQLGKLGGRTIGFYLGSSFLAIVTGLVMVNLVKPGVGADLGLLQAGAEGQKLPDVVNESKSVWDVLWGQLTSMIPTNPIAATADGDMLPIIFFSLLLGLFISVTGGESGRVLTQFFSSLFEVMMRMTLWVIGLAPFGVFGFMVFAAADKGVSAFAALGWYALTVFLALLTHALITLPLLLRVFGGRSPWDFAKALSPALLTAFSTASSNATLPLTMNCVEERAGVSNRVSSFVLPLGATINMDGTALYEAVAVLFIAQVYGYDLSLAQQMIVAFTALLASIGAAGIPHAGTVMMVVVLQAVGLPTEAVGLILAVDRILDMCRTTVNVWSDATATAVVAAVDTQDNPGAAREATPAV